MAITTLDGIIAALEQTVIFNKTASRTSVAAIPFSIFDLAGMPGAGTLAVGNTAAGIVPTDALAGTPTINAFSGANIGYISKVDFSNTVASRLIVYDRLFSAGAYAFNAAVTLASQPSYSARLPNTDYKGLELWLECVAAFTGNQTIVVTYTNQDGTTGRTTGTIATGIAPTTGRMLRLNLQAGDTGIQKIESVTSSVATVGTFNVHVMRKLWSGRVKFANDGDIHEFTKTGMPQVFADSCLFYIVNADSTSTGLPTIDIDIVNG
ncbi:hypothetical protein [Flavobacterium sp.]|uniref:hypothetical protein n=1 Tax=Flavobacterium sp. TaxID=239 RepID=UPI0037530A6F